MTSIKSKGKSFIINIESNWIEETGSRPTDTEIVDHIMNMDNEEFDCHVTGTKYTVRQEIHEDYDKTMERLKAELKSARDTIEKLKNVKGKQKNA